MEKKSDPFGHFSARKRLSRRKGYTIKMGRGTDEQTILEDVADCDALLARNEHITRASWRPPPA